MNQLVIEFELTQEESMILTLLEDHRGRENAITGSIIARCAGIPYDRVREIISHLVTTHNYLLGSYSRGYYMIVDSQEVDETCRSLRHRAISILYRAARIKKQSVEEIFHQARIEFKEGEAA